MIAANKTSVMKISLRGNFTMSHDKFPEKFTEHGKSFNRLSEADPGKLEKADYERYQLLERQKHTEVERIKSENVHYREQRITQETDRLLRTPAAGLNGPKPILGGRRVDRSDGVARSDLSPEELSNIRRTAEQNVSKAENVHLQAIEQAYTQGQKNLLDKALGPNRYPSRSR
jgi:hypothetical protein